MKINNKFNSSTLENIPGKQDIKETEVADVMIKTDKPIVVENFNSIPGLGRFVLVRDEDSAAGGIILK